ncbi:MAG TPA: hypothetical protein VE088_02710 [Gaiellaceae bacterium]|nr:hypothetical protein [Gaiellaceae bacterium]
MLLPVALVAAACGAGTSRTGRTVTFRSSGAFPTSTIVGRHSASGCTADARTVVRNARLYYAHSTVAPGPADLYYYDLRFAYAHFEADACTSGGLGREMRRRLTARQRTFLLGHVASDLHRALRAALNGS